MFPTYISLTKRSIQSIVAEGREWPPTHKATKTHCVGVQGILNLDNTENSSDVVEYFWQYPDGTVSNCSEQVPVCQYKSEQR